jgi:hypothetical protein
VEEEMMLGKNDAAKVNVTPGIRIGATHHVGDRDRNQTSPGALPSSERLRNIVESSGGAYIGDAFSDQDRIARRSICFKFTSDALTTQPSAPGARLAGTWPQPGRAPADNQFTL